MSYAARALGNTPEIDTCDAQAAGLKIPVSTRCGGTMVCGKGVGCRRGGTRRGKKKLQAQARYGEGRRRREEKRTHGSPAPSTGYCARGAHTVARAVASTISLATRRVSVLC